MGRVYTDTEKLLKAVRLERNGHHREAAGIYRSMGNEVRSPAQKEQLWAAANAARKKCER